MDKARPQYHERFLHWIWSSLHLDLNRLESICGKPITILEPGELNSTDGPDFKKARIQIGNLQWHGDVEIHWSVAGWTAHGHHQDPRYNRVILHVVYEDPADEKSVRRQDGSTLFTLHLRPHLPAALHKLIDRFHRKDRLPCAGSVSYISEEAFKRQIDHAHRQYFEVKTDLLLKQFYAPELSPSLAWKRMLILGLFDGLGISHNREPMQALGRELFDRQPLLSTRDDLEMLAVQLAGFTEYPDSGSDSETALSLRWNRKACRPGNRPEVRIRQAVGLMWHIHSTPLERWFGNSPEILWKELLRQVRTTPSIGKERGGILYGVVFLPAVYLLGHLFDSEPLRQQTFQLWQDYKTGIPRSLFQLYKNSGIPSEIYKDKLGAVYQLKHYCRCRRCQDCRVLKHAIYP